MFRSFFVYLSQADWAKHTIMKWNFAWRAARRFVAGEKLEDGIEAVRNLNALNINATLDQLGENTETITDAERATQGILEMLEAIQAAQVRANVSIKLTQIGLKLNQQLCAENVHRILGLAKKYNNFVRIDMEDASCVDDTLRIFYDMRVTKGYDNVGLVIQAYLYRTMDDLAKLLEIPARIRLCKGAYKESEDVAFPRKKDVNENYDRASKLLLDAALKAGAPVLSADKRIPPIPAIATHDENRIAFAKDYSKQIGLPKDAMEFQMLYGIRRELQIKLAAEGYPVRVYVPFGSEWYAYNMRRLAERPANLWFFISNFFKK